MISVGKIDMGLFDSDLRGSKAIIKKDLTGIVVELPYGVQVKGYDVEKTLYQVYNVHREIKIATRPLRIVSESVHIVDDDKHVYVLSKYKSTLYGFQINKEATNTTKRRVIALVPKDERLLFPLSLLGRVNVKQDYYQVVLESPIMVYLVDKLRNLVDEGIPLDKVRELPEDIRIILGYKLLYSPSQELINLLDLPSKLNDKVKSIINDTRIEYGIDKPTIRVVGPNESYRLSTRLTKLGMGRRLSEEIEKILWGKNVSMMKDQIVFNKNTTTYFMVLALSSIPHDAILSLEGVVIDKKGDIKLTEEGRFLMSYYTTCISRNLRVLDYLGQKDARNLVEKMLVFTSAPTLLDVVLVYAPDAIGFDKNRHKFLVTRTGDLLIRSRKGKYLLTLYRATTLDPNKEKEFVVFQEGNPYPVFIKARTIDEAFQKAYKRGQAFFRNYREAVERLKKEKPIQLHVKVGDYILEATFPIDNWRWERLSPETVMKKEKKSYTSIHDYIEV